MIRRKQMFPIRMGFQKNQKNRCKSPIIDYSIFGIPIVFRYSRDIQITPLQNRRRPIGCDNLPRGNGIRSVTRLTRRDHAGRNVTGVTA